MTDQLAKIAKRLQKAREKNDLTLKYAAFALGITPEELQTYESGEEDIPVSFLHIAAKKYNVELSALLTGEDPHQHTYAITRKDEGIMVDRRKQYDYQSLCADFVDKKIEPLLVTVDPVDEDTESEYNSHPGQEFHYLLEGRMKVIIGKKEVTLNPGDSLMFNSEQSHTLRALDKKQAKFLVVIT